MAGATGRVQTRRDLSAAALALFADRGYEATTVDQIAVAAGVARRTFFRYFPTKEDAVFPDHDSTVTRVQSVLDAASPTGDPIDVVCEGVREVLRMYATDPTVAVARYRLLREVPALREREIAVVSRYQRLFTKFLLSNWAAESSLPDAALYAEVSAAAVVAAHNHVLRQWLRADARGDVFDQLDRALDSVRHRFTEIVVRRRKRVLVTVTEVGTDNEEIISAVRDALRLPVIRPPIQAMVGRAGRSGCPEPSSFSSA